MPNMTKYGPELPMALLNTLPDPVFVKDSDLRYVWVNTAFEEFFGLAKDDVVGKRDGDLFEHASGRPQPSAAISHVLDTGLIDEVYETIRHPDGDTLELATRKTRLDHVRWFGAVDRHHA